MRTPTISSIRQAGVTLTELMIALVLGALVVLAATAMVVTSRGTYRTQDETTRLQESARFGAELGNRLVRIAGFTNWGDDLTAVPPSYTPDPLWTTTPDAYAVNGPNIVGANNSKPGGTTGINGSDSLVIHFFGSSPKDSVVADGNVLDCAGVAVPQPPVGPSATSLAVVNNAARAMNILYVDNDTDGEPSLFCLRQKYDPTTGLATGLDTKQVLIRGVEVMQVLYGEWVPSPPPADDLDQNPPATIVYRTGIGGPNPVVKWGNVRSVRIALLLRSGLGARTDPEASTATYSLFGADYPVSTDNGTTFSLSSVSTQDRTRVRRVVMTTVFVRNRENQWSSVTIN